MGHGVAWAIAEWIRGASVLAVEPTFVIEEALVVAGMVLLAAAAGLLPAYQPYRQDVASNLAPR